RADPGRGEPGRAGRRTADALARHRRAAPADRALSRVSPPAAAGRGAKSGAGHSRGSQEEMKLVCGVDEAGRGPNAGPVSAAAVILGPAKRINGLADSKILTPERRAVLAERIKERAIAWAVAHASVEEIDRINILRASLLAMRRAVELLKMIPAKVLFAGIMCPHLPSRPGPISHGGATPKPISVASI